MSEDKSLSTFMSGDILPHECQYLVHYSYLYVEGIFISFQEYMYCIPELDLLSFTPELPFVWHALVWERCLLKRSAVLIILNST